jgi:hypothetical protein
MKYFLQFCSFYFTLAMNNFSFFNFHQFELLFENLWPVPMFVERNVRFSVLFTNLVGRHDGAVSFQLSDIVLAQLVCPLSDVMFCLHSGITNLSLYKHWPVL